MNTPIDDRIRRQLTGLDEITPRPPTWEQVQARRRRSRAPRRALAIACATALVAAVLAVAMVATRNGGSRPTLSVPAASPATTATTSPSTTVAASTTTASPPQPLQVVPLSTSSALDGDKGIFDVVVADPTTTPGELATSFRVLYNFSAAGPGTVSATSDDELDVTLGCLDGGDECLSFTPNEVGDTGVQFTVRITHTAAALSPGEHTIRLTLGDTGTIDVVVAAVPGPSASYSDLATSITGPPQAIQTVGGVGNFDYHAINAFGSIWVLGATSATVTRVDAVTGAVQATIDVRTPTATGHRLAATDDAVYVNGDPALRIDPATNAVTELSQAAPSKALTSDGSLLWTATRDGGIQRIDPDGAATTLDLPDGPWLDLAWNHGIVWAVSQVHGGGRLIAFDAATSELLHDETIDPGANNMAVRLVADEHSVAIGVDTSGGGGRTGELLLIDPHTAALASTIALDSRPEGIILTPDHIWTSGAVIDRTTHNVLPMPFGFTIARGPDGSIWGTSSVGGTTAGKLTRFAPGDRRG